MSLVMEEQSQPVFRDFLGPAPPAAATAPVPIPESKQQEYSASDSVRVSQNSGFMEPEDGEASVRGGSTFSAAAAGAPGPSTAAPGPGLDPETEIWRGSKPGAPFAKAPGFMSDEMARRREELAGRSSHHDHGEGSRPAKISRFKQRDEPLPSTGDLCLAMQPPRPGQASNMWLQSSVFKPESSSGNPKRMDSSSRPMMARPIPGVSGAPGAPPAAGVGVPPPGMYSRNPGSSSMQPPPADEGSRTGLQGGGIAALISNANNVQKLPSSATTRPVGEPASILERSASLERPKLPLQNGVPDSLLKTPTTSATRQLTIFYGGHANVFEDVSPEKADAIMQLAGSNGRSWSTSYAHRSSRSEGSLIDLERRRDKPVNHQNGSGSSSLGVVPAEMQNSHTLQNINYAAAAAGIPRKHHRMVPEHPGAKLPADVPLPSVADGNRYAAANGRAANLHNSYYNVKEASGNGQHWL